MKAQSRSYANVALVKYFGKRNTPLNLPAAPSLSLTIKPLCTTTEVAFDESLKDDEVLVGGSPASEAFARRVSSFLDILRAEKGDHLFARVSTDNNFPTAAGLASSASGFAALVVAASKAIGLELSQDELSRFARRGSGSACRSIVGGVGLWERGELDDGSDSFARSIMAPEEWDLRIVVGVTQTTPKETGSTDAMEHTRLTSPFYDAWIRTAHEDVAAAVKAVENRQFDTLGEITERSALAMHAAIMASRPGIVFLKGTTLEAYHLVRSLRKQGTQAYFTCDAGPQPKVLCMGSEAPAVEEALSNLPGITRTISCSLAEGATLLD